MDRREVPAKVAEGYVGRRQFAGIEWHVEQAGATLTSGRVGAADTAGTPIPDSAIYRIYSMTKPVVSLMALILVEQGRLRLFDLLPQFNRSFAGLRVLSPNGDLVPAVRPITVEDLLTHRAGFTYEFITGCHIAPGYDAIDVTSDGSITLDEMMERIASQPLAFQPGTQYRYSVCTDVLAHVIERATGERLGDLLCEHLFDPLGMNDTGFFVPDDKRDRLLPMFGIKDIRELSPLNPPEEQLLTPTDVEDTYPSSNPDFVRGGHGLFSTLDDYGKFARMLLDGRSPGGQAVLSRKMLEMMTANRIPPSQLPLKIGINALPGYGWGLGVRVMMDPGQALSLTGAGEFGWAGAASTYFWVDPRELMTGVIMTQYLGSMQPLLDDLRGAAYQLLE